MVKMPKAVLIINEEQGPNVPYASSKMWGMEGYLPLKLDIIKVVNLDVW